METNLEPLKEDVLKTLRAGETTVRFTKVDGSEREMRCTLSDVHIPTDKHPKTSQSSSTAGSAIRVFDLDKSEWRSFRLESLISYK
jgi:WYL_2, Sm-like SH3 beta-barrel fold